MKRAPFIILLALGLVCVGAARKPNLSVRFHVETNARDGDVFAMPVTLRNPPRKAFVERVPTISERDIRAIYPTTAVDGSFGCGFMLNAHGKNSLQTISTMRRGSSMVVFVSTKGGVHQVVDLTIDRPISDGIIYVPHGLTQLEITALHKQFPTAGDKPRRK